MDGRCGGAPLAPPHAAPRPREAGWGKSWVPRVSPGDLGLRWAPASIRLLPWCWAKSLVPTPDRVPVSPTCFGGWVPTWAPVLPTVCGQPKARSVDLGCHLCGLHSPTPPLSDPLAPSMSGPAGMGLGCPWEEAVAVRPVSGEGAHTSVGNAHQTERGRVWKHG